jgi:hypothetical protein
MRLGVKVSIKKHIIGKTFGNLKVVKFSRRDDNDNYLYLCECKCGGSIETTRGHLVSGHTRKCGISCALGG